MSSRRKTEPKERGRGKREGCLRAHIGGIIRKSQPRLIAPTLTLPYPPSTSDRFPSDTKDQA